MKLPTIRVKASLEHRPKESVIANDKVVNSRYEPVTIEMSSPIQKHRHSLDYDWHELQNIKLQRTMLKQTVEEVGRKAKFKYLKKNY